MKLLLCFLFINLFNHFPQIWSNENTLDVQIRRAINNPEYGFLYSKDQPSAPPHFIVELHRYFDWEDKRENPVWKGQNEEKIGEQNFKFDKFTFAQLPDEWIEGMDLNLDYRDNVLELRIELPETGEIRFRPIQLMKNANGLHLKRIDILPTLEKQKHMHAKINNEWNDELASRFHLYYAKQQFANCVKKREEVILILTGEITKPKLNMSKVYYVEAYRDLQWQIYNVQRLHLNELEKIFDNGVLEVNDKFKEFEENLPKTKQEMNEYLHKILTAQTKYIIARKEDQPLEKLCETLIELGKPVDEEANNLDKKIMYLQNLIIKEKKKENTKNNSPTGQGTSGAKSPIKNYDFSRVQMLNFASNTIKDDYIFDPHHPAINSWPTHQISTKHDAYTAAGSSKNAEKRKMAVLENDEIHILNLMPPAAAGSPQKKHAKSSSSHKGSTDSERTISDEKQK